MIFDVAIKDMKKFGYDVSSLTTLKLSEFPISVDGNNLPFLHQEAVRKETKLEIEQMKQTRREVFSHHYI